MKPLVSIIIPTYNSGSFLKRSIESVLEQTYDHKEIIIVDDGSADDSFEIARSFEHRGVKAVQQSNAGAAVARNTGLDYATGDYIQFLDADDFLSLDKIEQQVAALITEPYKIAVCNYTGFVHDYEIEKLVAPDQSSFIFSSNDPVDFLVNLWGGNGESNFIQTNCWLVPRVVIDKVGGWRPYRCPDDDGEFFARVILASKGILYVPDIMNYYRRATGVDKLSANSTRKYVQNILLTIDLKYKYLKAVTKNQQVEKAFAKQYLDFAVYQYPKHKIFSSIAYKRFKQLERKAKLPVLGGELVESVKKILGWKVAQLIKHFLK